jgi:hypothetical protein
LEEKKDKKSNLPLNEERSLDLAEMGTVTQFLFHDCQAGEAGLINEVNFP